MGNKSKDRQAQVFRRKVRELLWAGKGTAAIAKETGKSYAHTQRIVAQVVAEIDAERKEQSNDQ